MLIRSVSSVSSVDVRKPVEPASLIDRLSRGAGGMATVYLAQNLKHERKVALKDLRPELARWSCRSTLLTAAFCRTKIGS